VSIAELLLLATDIDVTTRRDVPTNEQRTGEGKPGSFILPGMKTIRLGKSDLHVTPICLGTMTFGEQVDESTSHAILSRAIERGVNFLDTAEMYAVPARKETYGATETIIGNWLQKNPGMRQKIVLATKVAGPSRGMPWVREGAGLTAQDILNSCEGSLRRLKTDVIDLYQIHWPERNVPMFGSMYYDPKNERTQTSIHEQLEAMQKLVKQGKVRYIGLSNETPYGVHEFVRLAEQHDLPRVATVQNVYCLVSRALENGLDETMHRLDVSLLAYSPLAFGLLTGKYDDSGTDGPNTPRDARIGKFESVRKQRWGRAEALEAARRYNALARANGLSPTKMALAWCYTKWQVASTIIGVRTMAQLEEDLDAWGTKLSPELLAEIDKIRWEIRDPAV
jgi:aryl-alcohol dehydrogenase-like predicted oxidoreductase